MITSLLAKMLCGWCKAPLAGPVNSWWRVLLDTGPIYLCSADCVYKAWPWRLEVSHDRGN
jgi:hypothetical protein